MQNMIPVLLRFNNHVVYIHLHSFADELREHLIN